MNHGYAAAGQDTAALTPPTPREPTINERLNRAFSRLQSQCERIESVLARVNGTQTAAHNIAHNMAKIEPTLPMATAMEHLESAMNRLTELTNHVERIA